MYGELPTVGGNTTSKASPPQYEVQFHDPGELRGDSIVFMATILKMIIEYVISLLYYL